MTGKLFTLKIIIPKKKLPKEKYKLNLGKAELKLRNLSKKIRIVSFNSVGSKHPDFYREGRGFEPLIAHKKTSTEMLEFFYDIFSIKTLENLPFDLKINQCHPKLKKTNLNIDCSQKCRQIYN